MDNMVRPGQFTLKSLFVATTTVFRHEDADRRPFFRDNEPPNREFPAEADAAAGAGRSAISFRRFTGK